MDFSRIDAACGIGLACRFATPKYDPASARTQTAAMPLISSVFLFDVLPAATLVPVCPTGSCSCWATSAADCGLWDGSFARQAATTFPQTCETDAGSMSNSFRRSVIEGATRSQICQSIFPE